MLWGYYNQARYVSRSRNILYFTIKAPRVRSVQCLLKRRFTCECCTGGARLVHMCQFQAHLADGVHAFGLEVTFY